ncbi:MAG TPA: TadE family protein [Candidatus Obscuribacterales bacterium]
MPSRINTSVRVRAGFIPAREPAGQSMVEFALAIPFLLLAIFSIIYFGRMYYLTQSVLFAAQEGARAAARVPELRNPAVRDLARGFTVDGQEVNPDSIIYAALGSARLLSSGTFGHLPPGARVKILPWDSDGTEADYTPPGTIAVAIEYPFQLLGNPFTDAGAPELQIAMTAQGQGQPVPFYNIRISEKATVSQEIYQEGD